MNSVGDAFGFPFRSPNWLGTVVVQGLILIIPIVGQIALLGWLLTTVDNLRAGRQELAPAGFHLGRGIALFGVELVYGIGLFLIPGILQVIGSAMLGQNNGVGGAVLALAIVLELAASLLLAFLSPVLILRTSELGFGGAMDVGAVWQQATANVGQTVVAALLMYVAGLIGSLGLILCFVGVFFTTAYAYGVTAGIVSWYERVQRFPSPSAAV
jgi:uncharacterized protein DUF4013